MAWQRIVLAGEGAVQVDGEMPSRARKTPRTNRVMRTGGGFRMAVVDQFSDVPDKSELVERLFEIERDATSTRRQAR